jgi:hypothetical protein
MNNNFNRQFILLDFRLLDDRDFLKFLSTNEFATYLVLRRNVWRSTAAHYMGLHSLYENERKLVCSLTRDKIAAVTGIAAVNISRHLSALEKKSVIKRVPTGRQNIYVLGEWIDVNGDGSYRVEWFYMEGVYGVSKADLTLSVRPDLTPTSDQTRRPASDNNREGNRQDNTVPNGAIKRLQDLNQPEEKTEYMAEAILKQMGDKHSRRFYEMVAAKVPEPAIRQAMAEIKADGADNPARLFTYKMQRYALDQTTAKA